jgi:CheY-like chemotaxis protein
MGVLQKPQRESSSVPGSGGKYPLAHALVKNIAFGGPVQRCSARVAFQARFSNLTQVLVKLHYGKPCIADPGDTRNSLMDVSENLVTIIGCERALRSLIRGKSDHGSSSKTMATTILCIDDEVAALEIRKLLLESEGYEVIEARSGKEGIELFKAQKVDLVILDYWMAGMNGTVTAQEIKRINPKVPIIMLSGYGELPGEIVGVADRWILKGRTAQELLDAVKALT